MNPFRDRRVLMVAADPAAPRPPGVGECLGYGDLLRVVALVPAFAARAVTWCSPPALHALVRDCPFLTGCVGDDRLAEAAAAHDVVVNLTFAPLPGLPGALDIESLLDDGASLKQRTFDLPRRLAHRLELEGTGAAMPVLRNRAPAGAVGFNWQVPDAWRIKALPEGHWRELAALLPPSATITRQPHPSTIDSYVDWVRSCRVMVSPVGLGCHLAMFYGVGLVMLSGPTDFTEAADYPLGRILRPPTPCRHRPCQLPQGVDNCGCMPDFRPADIAAAVLELLAAMDPSACG